jgi:hypothetical protein
LAARIRIKALGVPSVDLESGKRGRYRLRVFLHVGFDPATDKVIGLDDPIPKNFFLLASFMK